MRPRLLAARLRVAQPHLSREIRRLEDELDVPLFARDRRRVTLTAAGSALFEHACRILEQTAEAAHAAQRAHRGQTGQVRVGFSSSAGFGFLPDAVRRFRHKRPEVELVLAEFNSDEQPDCSAAPFWTPVFCTHRGARKTGSQWRPWSSTHS